MRVGRLLIVVVMVVSASIGCSKKEKVNPSVEPVKQEVVTDMNIQTPDPEAK